MVIEDREYLKKAADEVIRLIEVARKEARMYPSHHPAVNEIVVNLVRALEAITKVRPTASFNIAQGEVFLEEIPLPRVTMTQNEFVKMCAAKLIGTLRFRAGVTAEDVTKFIDILNEFKFDRTASHQKTFNEMLADEGVDYIDVSASVPLAKLSQQKRAATPEEQAARNDYDSATEAVYKTFQNLLAGRALGAESVEPAVNAMIRGLLVDRNVYRRLADIKDYDNYTFNHAVNVAILSLLVGIDIGLSMEQLNSLGVAALLHDVGKVAVPADVLNKPGKLSDEEWEMMRSHPVEGALILLEHGGRRDIAVTVAFEHHARYNLSGYPKISPGRELHFFSRIVGLSDVYDALTSDRSYRGSMMPDAAARIILSGSGQDFDPALTKVFVRSIGVFPEGCAVVLSNGEPAIVQEPNPTDPIRPKVRLVRGNKVLDLSGIDLYIRRCVDVAAPALAP
jgi:HD-GYP domain-containing protein (c-di-GMP phosphodiesterase class II)